jgi:hypothetical protein
MTKLELLKLAAMLCFSLLLFAALVMSILADLGFRWGPGA